MYSQIVDRRNSFCYLYSHISVPDIGKVLKLLETMGDNIQYIQGNKRMVKLEDEHPGTLCRLSRRLHCGEEVTLSMKRLKDHDGFPSAPSIEFGISSEGLRNGSLHDEHPFTAASRTWTIRKVLDNHDCHGKIHISVSVDGIVSMTNSKGVREHAHLSPSEMQFGLAVVFRLFRCNVEIVNYKVKSRWR